MQICVLSYYAFFTTAGDVQSNDETTQQTLFFQAHTHTVPLVGVYIERDNVTTQKSIDSMDNIGALLRSNAQKPLIRIKNAIENEKFN